MEYGDYLVYVMRTAAGEPLPDEDDRKYPQNIVDKLKTDVDAWEAQLAKETGIVHMDFNNGFFINTGNCFWDEKAEKAENPASFAFTSGTSQKFQKITFI